EALRRADISRRHGPGMTRGGGAHKATGPRQAQPAERAVAADRAGMTAFRRMLSTRPARRLNFGVRWLAREYTMASGHSMDDAIREGAPSASSQHVRPDNSLAPAIRPDQPLPTPAPPALIRRRASLTVSLLVGLKRFLIERAWSALPLGATLGL